MKCDGVPEAVSARADGEIDPQEERDLIEHLEGCPACAEEAELLEEVAAETAALLRARAADLPRSAAPASRSRMAPAVAIAAAVLLAVGVYLFLPSPQGGTGESTAASPAEVEAVEDLDRSVTEVAEEWDALKRDLKAALLRVKEKGIDVTIPQFLSES